MLINCYACMHALYYEAPLKNSCALYFEMEGVQLFDKNFLQMLYRR